jgi:hypothetical protein
MVCLHGARFIESRRYANLHNIIDIFDGAKDTKVWIHRSFRFGQGRLIAVFSMDGSLDPFALPDGFLGFLEAWGFQSLDPSMCPTDYDPVRRIPR